METPARSPEHEPARRRLSLLTWGSRRCPGPGSTPRAPSSRLQASSLGLQRWSPSHTCPDVTPDGRRRPPPAAPGRCQAQRALAPRQETGISRGHLPSLLLAPLLGGGARAPLLGLPHSKLISPTCQFALVWKILKNLETFGDTAAPDPSGSARPGLSGTHEAVAFV